MSRYFRVYFLCFIVFALSDLAEARNSSLYFGINPGFQFYDTEELIIDKGEDTNGDKIYPSSGFSGELKIGTNIAGYGGAEIFLSGHFWGSGDQLGGGGFAGGKLRWTPLEAFKHLYRPLEKRIFDFGLSFGAGYTLVGEDYAYRGWFLQYGFDFEIFVFSFMSVGFELPIRQMIYEPFRYTELTEGCGLCTNGAKAYGKDGREVLRTAVRKLNNPDGSNIGKIGVDQQGRIIGNYFLSEYSDDEIDKCSGKAPNAWQFAPMLKITFIVDFGI